ncbi:phage antirepressor KilAC domain-containing protein [Candidatus Vagococcus giribetii]|uniref:phage antirepressor KilAC domain-containing protein n=1 Tax=Candidatus Vagococcus giribetii TaxID=2230876 RepID=UPI003F88189B
MFFLIKRKSTVWNTPTQHSMDLGLFEIKQSSIQHDNGHILISRTPKVTVKGQ